MRYVSGSKPNSQDSSLIIFVLIYQRISCSVFRLLIQIQIVTDLVKDNVKKSSNLLLPKNNRTHYKLIVAENWQLIFIFRVFGIPTSLPHTPPKTREVQKCILLHLVNRFCLQHTIAYKVGGTSKA